MAKKLKVSRVLPLLVVMLLLTSLFAGCASSTTPAASSDKSKESAPAATKQDESKPAQGTPAASKPSAGSKEPYKIGVVFSTTGALAGLGGAFMRATEVEVDGINAKGGIDGHPIQMISYDDQSRPEELSLIYKKLVQQDKVSIILGSAGAAVFVPSQKLVEELKTPVFAAAALNFTKNDKYLFSVVQPAEMGIDLYLDYCQKKGWTRIAALHPTDDLGERSDKYLKKVVPERGMQLVAAERFGLKDTDITPQLSKIKAANPQAIIAWASGDPAVLVYKNARQLGIDAPVFPSSAASSISFFKLTGEIPKEGLLYTLGSKMQIIDTLPDSDPLKAEALDFAKRFQAKYNARPELTESFAWDQVHIAAQALKAVGPDRDKLRDYIENITFNGLSSNIKMTPDNHNGIDRNSLLMVMGLKDKWVRAN